MAYVAISRFRTLAGLHLLGFDPRSIKVNTERVQEVNRLRQQYKPDLPPITLYNDESKPTKHKLSALLLEGESWSITPHLQRASSAAYKQR